MSDPTTSDTKTEEPPKIEFPCAGYPIKVMGPTTEDFKMAICAIIRDHAPDLDEQTAELRASKKGNYLSLTVKITATGTDQLSAIFEALKASGRVSMVL